MSSTLSFNLPFEFFTSSILLIYKSSDFVLWILKKHGTSCFKMAKIPFHPSENTILVILVFPPCRVSVYSELFFFFHLVAWFSVSTLDFPGCLIILGGHQSSWEPMGTSGQCRPWLHSKRSQGTLMSQCFPSWLTHSPTWNHVSFLPGGWRPGDTILWAQAEWGEGVLFSIWHIYADYTCHFQSNVPTHVHLLFSRALLTLLSLGNKLLVFSIGRGRGSHPVIPNG